MRRHEHKPTDDCFIQDAENINALWGALIAEELARCGVEWFIVCPVSGWLRARALAIKAHT